MPSFGLRCFDSGGREIARLAPCFECHNVRIVTHEDVAFAQFDAESTESTEMLAILRSLAPA
jgi:hypothetical protein